MAWVNLNDVYVNKTGGTITGDLTVNGSIKVNDGKGDGGIYNVANEITTLRDSVSQIVESGKRGIWTYTKYADGTAECHGTAKYSITRKGTYWLPEVSLPFTMVKPANSCDYFTIIVSGGGYFAPVLYPDYPETKSSISAVQCAVADVTDTGNIFIGYSVHGRWK